MATTNGLLSQSIQNIQVAIQNVSAITGLPAAAQAISTSAVNLLQAEIPKIAAVQNAAIQFVNSALPQMQQVQTDLNSTTPDLTKDAATITQLNTATAALQQQVDALNTDIANTKAQLISLDNATGPVLTQLTNQKISLATQVQSAQQEADSIQSKIKYFFALGVFGLVGLAAATIAYSVEESKVNNLLAQASALNAQINTLNMMIQAVTTLTTDFSGIITTISDVKNAVDFVAGDASDILNDLTGAGGANAAKTYVITTISMLQTLQTDVS